MKILKQLKTIYDINKKYVQTEQILKVRIGVINQKLQLCEDEFDKKVLELEVNRLKHRLNKLKEDII